MTCGPVASSKWQATASRTCCRNSSTLSASLKIDCPKARAVQPPSGASSTRKIISLIAFLIRPGSVSCQDLFDRLGCRFDDANRPADVRVVLLADVDAEGQT